MSQELSEDQWTKIKADILSRNAILFLGPSATINYGEPRQDQYFRQLSIDYKDLITSYHEKDGFLVFNRQKNGRNDLGGKISAFYQGDFQNELLEVLAEIPFHLYVSVTPDESLSQVFRKLKYTCDTDYFRREPSEEQFRPSVAQPLIYNLMGYAYDENSLVLSHGALFNMISFLQKKDSLPNAVVEAFSPAIGGSKKSMIFLGFEFDKWYYHFLMFMLRINEGVTHFAASPNIPDPSQLALYEAHFETTFIQHDLLGFAKELCGHIPPERRRSAEIGRLSRFREFLLEAIGEDEFMELCTKYFSKVKREFTAGQNRSPRVELLLEEVQRAGSWALLGAKLKEINLARYTQDIESR